VKGKRSPRSGSEHANQTHTRRIESKEAPERYNFSFPLTDCATLLHLKTCHGPVMGWACGCPIRHCHSIPWHNMLRLSYFDTVAMQMLGLEPDMCMLLGPGEGFGLTFMVKTVSSPSPFLCHALAAMLTKTPCWDEMLGSSNFHSKFWYKVVKINYRPKIKKYITWKSYCKAYYSLNIIYYEIILEE